MALPTTYNTGTATVNNGSTAVTGQGTTWLTSGVQAGDFFWAAGQAVRILSVNSNTSLTLAYNWPGASRSADIYEIVFTPEAGRVLASTRAVLDALSNGNVAALAALVSAANKLPYFTGDGVADVTDLSAHARAMLALSGGAGKFVRSTGANTAVMADMVGAVSKMSGAPTGAIIERGSNANGDYTRYVDGTQECWATVSDTAGVATAIGGLFWSPSDIAWTFPVAFTSSLVFTAIASRTDRPMGIVQTGSSGNGAVIFRFWSSTALAPPATAIGRVRAIGRWD